MCNSDMVLLSETDDFGAKPGGIAQADWDKWKGRRMYERRRLDLDSGELPGLGRDYRGTVALYPETHISFSLR
jgi:hypothetical protein